MARASIHYLKMLDELKHSLSISGFTNQAEELDHEIFFSFTSTEICIKCGSLLISFQNNLKLNKDTTDRIDEFLDYCQSIGLYIKSK